MRCTHAARKVGYFGLVFPMAGVTTPTSIRLPLMYKCVRRTLSVPHTSCDVGRFSVWKCACSDKQHNMKEGTHKAYVSFRFQWHSSGTVSQ